VAVGEAEDAAVIASGLMVMLVAVANNQYHLTGFVSAFEDRLFYQRNFLGSILHMFLSSDNHCYLE
jgi:hypothetical protein